MSQPMPAGVFRLAGPDRRGVLNGLLTNDVRGLPPGEGAMACLLTPKGKIISPVMALERGEDFVLVTPPQTAAAFSQALGKYLAVSDSALEDLAETRHAVFEETRGHGACALPKQFWGAAGWIAVAEGKGPAGYPEGWEARRVAAGVPVFGVDVNDVYPTELGWDFLLNETKGCYVGQETTARLRFKGQANHKWARLKLSGAAAGDALVLDGKEVGRLTSAAGEAGVSLLARDAAVAGTVLEAGRGKAEVL